MRQTITIGNPEGVGKRYSVEIGSSSYAGSQMFIVNDVFSEQEALDAAVDYCEEHGWNGLFWDNEEQAQEYPDDFITAGNHGHLLPSDQVIVHSINESKKQTIKLNESQLRMVVSEAVKKVLNERANMWDNKGQVFADSESYRHMLAAFDEMKQVRCNIDNPTGMAMGKLKDELMNMFQDYKNASNARSSIDYEFPC